ncbi:hypothetical protein [Henriciella marina]|uniref:Co-chaperone DjlA N-terminal domain-containing protein n=1 Tax=Henriciella marina TaxID=453851 RepID=A0ABT4LVA1_9PROT|nr:hypothetical protein [Henriciella marina]MCZ4298303.1 hypothetical protein [Henriciella marina]
MSKVVAENLRTKACAPKSSILPHLLEKIALDFYLTFNIWCVKHLHNKKWGQVLMGLLDKFANRTSFDAPERPSRADIQNAVGIIGICAVASDGHIDKNEIVDLQNTCISMPLFADVVANQALVRAEKLVSKNFEGALSYAIGVLRNSGWAETGFTVACNLVFSDAQIDQEEANFVEMLKSSLGVSEEFSEAVVTTLASLYRAS